MGAGLPVTTSRDAGGRGADEKDRELHQSGHAAKATTGVDPPLWAQTMRTFQAAIFDFGGVITASPFEAFNRLEAERGLPHDLVRRINAADPDSNAWALLERAEIDRVAFDVRFAAEAAALGHQLRGADVLEVIAGAIRPGMVAALDTIRAAGLKLGCITNNVPGSSGPAMANDAAAESRYAAIFARFDHVIESAKAGVRKPDPRIYAMMCEALDVARPIVSISMTWGSTANPPQQWAWPRSR